MIESILPYALGILSLGILVMVLYFLGKKERQRFQKKFPPISDAEFLARCRPGTNPEVALKVRRIVSDCLGVEYARIHPSTRFVEDLGAG